MKLATLLDELRTNILRDDAELASGPDDQLWSDEALVRYINDAQRKFAKRTFSLRDASTPSVVEVALATGVATYTLHKAVLALYSARYDTDVVDLARAGHTVFFTYDKDDPCFLDPSTAATWNPGRPRAYSTDEALDRDSSSKGSLILTVFPTPTSTEDGKIVYLRVARMPLNDFDIDHLDLESELDEDDQLDMLEWAAFRAMNTSDIDGHDAQADKHAQLFEKAVRDTLRKQRIKMRAPMRFEFGRAGFTW